MESSHTKNLAYFQNLKYEVRIRRKNGSYILYIPELSCIVEDVNLEKAYEKLESEKKMYFQKMIDGGLQNQTNTPLERKKKQDLIAALIPFGIKFVIVIATIMIIMNICLNVLNESPQIASKLAKELVRSALLELSSDIKSESDLVTVTFKIAK